MITSKYQVYDRKKEIFRDIKYRDIAMLLRSTKDKASMMTQIPIIKNITLNILTIHVYHLSYLLTN